MVNCCEVLLTYDSLHLCCQVQGILRAGLQDPVSERDAVCQPLRYDEGRRATRTHVLQRHTVSEGMLQ